MKKKKEKYEGLGPRRGKIFDDKGSTVRTGFLGGGLRHEKGPRIPLEVEDTRGRGTGLSYV